MAKKNRKARRNTKVSIYDKSIGIRQAVFDYMENQFYCVKCSHKVNWTGGSYDGNSTMEVLECTYCHRVIDPRLVWDAALKLLGDWERRQSEYRAECARKAELARQAEEARREAARLAEYHKTLRGRLSRVLPFVS